MHTLEHFTIMEFILPKCKDNFIMPYMGIVINAEYSLCLDAAKWQEPVVEAVLLHLQYLFKIFFIQYQYMHLFPTCAGFNACYNYFIL